MKSSPYLSILLAATLVASAYAAAPADKSGTIEGAVQLNAADPMEASRSLGPSYKKESDGFKFTPPAGAKIVERAGAGLVSFSIDSKSWYGSVQYVRDTAAKLEDFLITHKNDLEKNSAFQGFRTLDQKA